MPLPRREGREIKIMVVPVRFSPFAPYSTDAKGEKRGNIFQAYGTGFPMMISDNSSPQQSVPQG